MSLVLSGLGLFVGLMILKRHMAAYLLFVGLVAFAQASHAGETRLLVDMPQSGKTTAGALAKAKTSGFECFKVKLNGKGNAARVKNTKSLWYEAKGFPEHSDAADAALGDGKVAVKCALKAYSVGKFRSTDIEDAE